MSGQLPRWHSRLAALLEIVGLFIVATLLARSTSRALKLGPTNLRALDPGVAPDFVSLSLSSSANLFLRYGLLLGLAFAVGWWHRRRRLSEYGVTTAGRPLPEHAGIALLLFGAIGMLPLLLKLLPEFLPIAGVPEHWARIESLQAPGIWLYLFVGSFGLVPIMEELLFRGYIQTRLSEDFGPAAAILMTALFFTFSHMQYFIVGPVGIGMLVSLFIASVASGYVRYRTGSLLPAVIAHALGNLPFRGWVEFAVLLGMVLIVAAWARPITQYVVTLWSDVMTMPALKTTLGGCLALVIVLAQVLLAPFLLPLTGLLALSVGLVLEAREKRANQPLPPTSIAAG